MIFVLVALDPECAVLLKVYDHKVKVRPEPRINNNTNDDNDDENIYNNKTALSYIHLGAMPLASIQ